MGGPEGGNGERTRRTGVANARAGASAASAKATPVERRCLMPALPQNIPMRRGRYDRSPARRASAFALGTGGQGVPTWRVPAARLLNGCPVFGHNAQRRGQGFCPRQPGGPAHRVRTPEGRFRDMGT